MAIAGLQRCGPDLTRTCFLDALLESDFLDLDGFSLRFAEDSQGSDQVFLTVIDETGRFRPTGAMWRQ